MASGQYSGGMGGSGRRDGVGVLTALAVFAMACGLVLMVWGRQPPVAKKESSQVAIYKQLDRLAADAHNKSRQAQDALESSNYGAARRLLSDLEQQVSILQFKVRELEAKPEN